MEKRGKRRGHSQRYEDAIYKADFEDGRRDHKLRNASGPQKQEKSRKQILDAPQTMRPTDGPSKTHFRPLTSGSVR